MASLDQESKQTLDMIHRRFGPWIRRRLRERFPSGFEDMAQDVFMRLGQALPNLRGRHDRVLKSYVARTLRSVCVDAIRSRARQPAGVGETDDLPDKAPSIPSSMMQKETIQRLQEEGLAALSSRDRAILRLRFHEGLTFGEIAEVLGVPQGSVAGWYSRAMNRLREVLA